MKKTKFMIGALVLSMGLLGTGYALWTDTLAVNTTVDTGNLNIKFDSLKSVDNYMNNGDNKVDGKYTTFKSTAGIVNGTTTGDYDNTADQINIEIKEMVPGASTTVKARMKNDGTVAARLATITADVKEGTNANLQEALNVEILVYDTDLLPIEIYKGTLKDLIGKNEEIKKDLLNRDILFVPNKGADEDIQLAINVEISDKAKNEIQGESADFALDFGFVQALEPVVNPFPSN